MSCANLTEGGWDEALPLRRALCGLPRSARMADEVRRAARALIGAAGAALEAAGAALEAAGAALAEAAADDEAGPEDEPARAGAMVNGTWSVSSGSAKKASARPS